MNIATKNCHKILGNQIQLYMKRMRHHEQVMFTSGMQTKKTEKIPLKAYSKFHK